MLKLVLPVDVRIHPQLDMPLTVGLDCPTVTSVSYSWTCPKKGRHAYMPKSGRFIPSAADDTGGTAVVVDLDNSSARRRLFSFAASISAIVGRIPLLS